MRRCAGPVVAIALPLCLFAELLPIRSYSTADGLAADDINRIVVDSRGFTWFCTGEGLSRFDGFRFVNFGVADGLPHGSIDALLETRSGEYLVGTSNGLCAFRAGDRGKFTTYLPGRNGYENAVRALRQDSSGRIWCGTRAGLFEMQSGHRFRRQLLPVPPDSDRVPVNDLMEDSKHKLWIATRKGIYVLGSDNVARRFSLGGMADNVRALIEDDRGGIWAGTQDGLALIQNTGSAGGLAVQHTYRTAGQSAGLDVTSLAKAPNGEVWAGTSAGIARWLPGSGAPVFRSLNRSQGLTDRQVNALTTDRTGNLWIGTEAAGVMKVQTAGFTTFREQDGLATDRVWSIVEDRAGAVLAVTASSAPSYEWLNVFDGKAFHALSVKGFSDHPPWGHQILLQARTGAWWAATGWGLCTYSAVPAQALAGRQPQACFAADTGIYRIFEDSRGRIWASSQQHRSGDARLVRWDPATNALALVTDGPNEHELIGAFAEDRTGGIWIATEGSGLFRYRQGKFEHFRKTDGVLTNGASELFVDSRGRMWLASADGLGVVDDPGSAKFSMRLYKVSDGLSSETVFRIAEDRAGRIYAGTSKGVDRLDPLTGRIKHFSTADGLAHGLVTAAMRDGSGDLWFATTQGLSRLSPTADVPPSVPSVRITGLQVGRRRYPVSQVGETRILPGDLQPSQNELRVGFAGFSDEPEAHLRYTYKLDGGESSWQGPGRDHEVNYPGLAPGAYQFLVKAINSEGQESAVPAEIDFVILPPVWRRWWFESLAVVAAALVVFLAYRRRLQGVTARVRMLYEERLDERTRIARELHDTLLQNLAGVSLQLDGVAKQVGPTSEETASRIQAVRRQVDASFREARQKVQDLRSPMLQGRSLPAVLSESIEQIAAGQPVAPRMTVSGHVRPLSEEVDEAILRIAQEAVANAVRHAQAGEITVSLAYDHRAVRLRVHDNGRGFDLHDTGGRVGHWGLRNMDERAHRIGAEWKVTTSPGNGTEIEAAVPLAPGG